MYTYVTILIFIILYTYLNPWLYRIYYCVHKRYKFRTSNVRTFIYVLVHFRGNCAPLRYSLPSFRVLNIFISATAVDGRHNIIYAFNISITGSGPKNDNKSKKMYYQLTLLTKLPYLIFIYLFLSILITF